MHHARQQQGFLSAGIIVAIAVILAACAALYLVLTPVPSAPRAPVACTAEAKLCPDGTAVGRVGPDCAFAPCPTATTDTNAPAPAPIPKPAPVPTPSGTCTADADCVAGLVCHAGTCTEPVGAACAGAGATCAAGYRCIQDCGPPVAREGDPPPPWHCVVDEIASKPRMCPICLASNATIATPDGPVPVTEVRVGMRVWSQDAGGRKVASTVLRVSKTSVPRTHRVIHVALADGREVWVSPDHPTADGRRVADLRVGEAYDGSSVSAADRVAYWDDATYDLLPDSDTGRYWADGILLGSTLTR